MISIVILIDYLTDFESGFEICCPLLKKCSNEKNKSSKFCFEEFFLCNRSIRILTEVKDKATLGYNIIDRWRYKQLFLAFFELIQLELEFSLFSLSSRNNILKTE